MPALTLPPSVRPSVRPHSKGPLPEQGPFEWCGSDAGEFACLELAHLGPAGNRLVVGIELVDADVCLGRVAVLVEADGS